MRSREEVAEVLGYESVEAMNAHLARLEEIRRENEQIRERWSTRPRFWLYINGRGEGKFTTAEEAAEEGRKLVGWHVEAKVEILEIIDTREDPAPMLQVMPARID